MAHIKTIFKKLKSTLSFFLCAVSLAHRTSAAKALHSMFQSRVPSGEWQCQHLCSAGLCAEALCMRLSSSSAQRGCPQLCYLEPHPTRKTSTRPPHGQDSQKAAPPLAFAGAGTSPSFDQRVKLSFASELILVSFCWLNNTKQKDSCWGPHWEGL